MRKPISSGGSGLGWRPHSNGSPHGVKSPSPACEELALSFSAEERETRPRSADGAYLKVRPRAGKQFR
jgi:hypothetical protein